MGFRFRRSVRVLPGVRLNFSKSGVSTSVGVRGAHVTIGHGHVRETVGLPGTGLSYIEVQHTQPHEHSGSGTPVQPAMGPLRAIANLIAAVVLLTMVGVLAYSCGTYLR